MMSGSDNSSLPEELRSAIEREPEERRRELERLWALLGLAEDRQRIAPSTDEAWTHVLGALHSAPARRDGRGPRLLQRTLAAAAIVILLGLGTWWMHRPMTVDVPAGEQQTVILPDGSTAALNSQTALRHARSFRSFPFAVERVVYLRGEAFFSVVPAGDPFVVETEDARIRVVGTAFNVRARSGGAENGTVVTLAEGSLRVSSRRIADGGVLLRDAGESASVPNAATPPRLQTGTATSLGHATAWRQQGFAVVDRPLEAVLNEVERRYAIEIAPRRGVDLSDSMNLFYLRGASPDQILRDVCLSQGCTYRETSRGFALDEAAADTGGDDGDPLSDTSR